MHNMCNKARITCKNFLFDLIKLSVYRIQMIYLFHENLANVVSESVLRKVVADLVRQPLGDVRRVQVRLEIFPDCRQHSGVRRVERARDRRKSRRRFDRR